MKYTTKTKGKTKPKTSLRRKPKSKVPPKRYETKNKRKKPMKASYTATRG